MIKIKLSDLLDHYEAEHFVTNNLTQYEHSYKKKNSNNLTNINYNKTTKVYLGCDIIVISLVIK